MPDSTAANANLDTADIPKPQTGELVPQNGEDSLAAPPDMGSIIAQHQIEAGKVNNGNPRDWAENTLAGVQAALAGFGAVGKVPEGAGALYGVGKAAEAAQKNRQEQNEVKQRNADRQAQLAIEKRRTDIEETGQNREYQLKLAENARQQAESLRQQSEHDKRMRNLDDEHNERNFTLMHQETEFRQQQIDREETLKGLGAMPMKIAGQETPAFDDLGQLEQYANQNKLAENAHQTGYRERPVLGADGKYRIYQVPDTGPEWHEVKDAAGKTTRIYGDPLSVLNWQEKVAQIKASNAETTLRYADAQKALNDFKEAGSVKQARKELSKVGGDYSKLSEGSREALRVDAQKQYDLSWNVYQSARRDMQRDADYLSIPVDAKGNPDTNSAEYKDLAAKYHVEQANEQLGSAYDDLRQLGHGYKPPGSKGTNPSTEGPAAPAKGTAITPAAAQQFLKLAGNDPEKAKQLAIAAGWGPPAQMSGEEAAAKAGPTVDQKVAAGEGAAPAL
jgi:hypothetical protein